MQELRWLRAEGETPLQHQASASFHRSLLLDLLLPLAQWSTRTQGAAGRVPAAPAAVLVLSRLYNVSLKPPLPRT